MEVLGEHGGKVKARDDRARRGEGDGDVREGGRVWGSGV